MLGLIVFGVLLLGGAAYRFVTARMKKPQGAGAPGGAAAQGAQQRTVEQKARDAARVVELGYVAEAALDTEHAQAPTPQELAAVAAVKAGDWKAGAEYVDAAGTDWDARWNRVRTLSELAAVDDAWLLEWAAARPADPLAALVNADAAVMVAWNVRGSQSGSRTTQEQFRLFHDLLLKAREAAQEAQRLADPADPVPYMVEQPIAQGLGYSNDDYRALWSQIVARAPKCLGAHTSAQQYWSQKWRGSHELALEFANGAAASAAPGELLTLLPLIAYVEQQMHEKDLGGSDFFNRPPVVAAVDAALADLAAAAPDDRRAVRLRHMLAWLLWWQDRDAEAVEQFRHIDGYIDAMPWYYAGSPRGRYLAARDWAVRVSTPGF